MDPVLARTDFERHLTGASNTVAQAVAAAPERLAAGTLTEADVQALERHFTLWQARTADLRKRLSGTVSRPEDLPVIVEAVALAKADLARLAADRPAVLDRLRDTGISRGPVLTEGPTRLRGLGERLIALAEADYQERVALAKFLRAQRTRLEGRQRRTSSYAELDASVDAFIAKHPVIMAYLAR